MCINLIQMFQLLANVLADHLLTEMVQSMVQWQLMMDLVSVSLNLSLFGLHTPNHCTSPQSWNPKISTVNDVRNHCSTDQLEVFRWWKEWWICVLVDNPWTQSGNSCVYQEPTESFVQSQPLQRSMLQTHITSTS